MAYNNFKPWTQLQWTRYSANNGSFASAASSLTYVGKTSTPGAGAGTADNPVNSLQVAGNLQVGTGQYVMAGGTGASIIAGDGYVVLRGPGSGTFANKPHLFGLDISGFEFLTNIRASLGGTTFASVHQCIIRGMQYHMFNDQNTSCQELMDSIMLNSPVTIYSTGYLSPSREHVSYNIFINSPLDLRPSVTLFCNYFDANSPITILTANGDPSTLPEKCNIRGSITIDGVFYPNLAAAAAAWPALLTKGNINKDPGFNRAEAEDFTLKLSSPHMDLGIGPRNLGYALMYYVDFLANVGDPCTTFNTRLRNSVDGSIVNFLSINGYTVNEQGGLIIMPNTQSIYEADFVTDRIRLASTPQPIDRLPFVFASNFDTDFPTAESAFNSQIPEVYNNNVPAFQNYAGGSSGRNPRRLTLQGRHSPNLNPLVNNAGDWVGNKWIDYEISEKPTYNAGAGFIGNGHPDFDWTPANVTQMVARWGQLAGRQRNNYYSRAT